ncbi:unnamed protein product [Diamesa hyperborea]
MSNLNKIVYAAVMLVCLTNVVLCEESDASVLEGSELLNKDIVESRTFGHHFLKRISFAIIPAAFVVGVITTLLGALTVVSIKGLGVGVILLVLTIGQLIARTLPGAVPLAAATYAAAPPPVPVYYKEW